MKKIYLCLLTLAIFLLKAIFPGICFTAIFSVLYEFEVISAKVFLFGVCSCTIITALISTVLDMVETKSEKKNKLINRMSMNSSKHVLFIIIFVLGAISLKNEIIWTYDELKDNISLQWTLFGISMTIFLVWNVLIIEYLKRQKPKCPSDTFPTFIWRYIQDKGDFYKQASGLFSSVNILTINIYVLIYATALTYITGKGITLINQNISIFSFFLCTNTLISLFSDVLQPLKEEKEELLKDTKVTDNDVELQNNINTQVSEVLIMLKNLDELDAIDEDQKYLIREEIFRKFTDQFSEALVPVNTKEGGK